MSLVMTNNDPRAQLEFDLRHPHHREEPLRGSPEPAGPTDTPGLHPQSPSYRAFYGALAELREEFHRTGRFDDANAKLDEIVKLLAIKFFEDTARPGESRFSLDYLRTLAASEFGEPTKIAGALRALSREVLSEGIFRNPDGTSIFGSDPSLGLQETDDAFAARIVNFVNGLGLVPRREASLVPTPVPEMDVLNEAFNHFIRDTFRNTKEDAQYMTPPEVVCGILDLVFADIEVEGELERIFQADSQDPYLIVDPACGTGSFLVGAIRWLLRRAARWGFSSVEVEEIANALVNACVYGQDKVDRMVRLASLNIMLFGAGRATVWQGNTVLDGSELEAFQGRVSLIVTNPPFGARYGAAEILRSANATARLPMLAEIIGGPPLARLSSGITVNSEVAILDRCFSLLRPGGRLAIILPDSVASSGGINEAVRRWVKERCELKAVIQLPSVTFALGGTRTKTVVVYLRKMEDAGGREPSGGRHIFTAVCADIGYRVVERQGATVRVAEGVNQLPAIADTYRLSRARAIGENEYVLVEGQPSCVWVREDCLINDKWTPNFYRADRLRALQALRGLQRAGFALVKLTHLADIRRDQHTGARTSSVFISVLHVGEDGSIDLRSASAYRPKTSGLLCRPGDVLLSKINPRIPRVCVVPDLAEPFECSTEFAVLRRKGIEPYLLAALLMHPLTRIQLDSLTSGTSSSHTRIKDSELGEILIPVPEDGKTKDQWQAISARLREAVTDKYSIEDRIWACRDQLSSAISDPSF
jgi:hypothetical protein